MAEGGGELRLCGKYRGRVEGVRAGLGASARQSIFEWLDSLPVEAVRDGKWLVIDNANYQRTGPNQLSSGELGRAHTEAEVLVSGLEERLGQEAWVWRLLPSSCTTGSSLSLLLPLDSCLPWVRRLLLLSLSFLSRDSAELLDRRIVVHWRWL